MGRLNPVGELILFPFVLAHDRWFFSEKSPGRDHHGVARQIEPVIIHSWIASMAMVRTLVLIKASLAPLVLIPVYGRTLIWRKQLALF